LELRVALEAERLREADHGRGRGAGAARELLGGLEGGLVEVVDDVAGDLLLRTGEVLEAIGDVARERLPVRPHGAGVAGAGAGRRRTRLGGGLAHGRQDSRPHAVSLPRPRDATDCSPAGEMWLDRAAWTPPTPCGARTGG